MKILPMQRDPGSPLPMSNGSPAVTRRATAVDIEVEISRESLRVRCGQALRVFPYLTGVLITVGFLLWHEVPAERLAGWLCLTFLALCGRVFQSRVVSRKLDEATPRDLDRFEREFLWGTVPLNLAMGSGIWWVGTADPDPEILFFVTLALCFYAIGALINLSSHARSFQLALSVNLGQAIVYWLVDGYLKHLEGEDWAVAARIAVPLIVIAYLLLSLGRENQRAFAQSVRMRFEKSAFLAAASHDLSQPLNALSLDAGTLSNYVREAKAHELLARMRSSIDVMQRLFNDLMDLARFDAGAVRPNIASVELTDIFREVEDLCRAKAEKKGLEWKLSRVAATVVTDRDLLGRALRNLVQNAINYTEVGTIAITSEFDRTHVRIRITDTGRGIAPEHLERVFDEFFQVGNPGRRREGGVGLGLSIVRSIDRLLGLDISITSQLGVGTQFTLRLPRARAQVETPAVEHGDEFMTKDDATGGLGLRVWILDDDESVRNALSDRLEVWECVSSAVATEGELSALKANEGIWPDVLIVDDMLGGTRSGLDVARACASHFDRARIIVMTGARVPERLSAIREAGFELMCKPVNPNELHARLREISRAHV